MNNYLTLKQKRSKFTKNERAVINALLEDAKTPDIKIAEKLKITTQAVGKIRKKLETEGVIRGYYATIDYEKVGITIFCLASFYVDPKIWKKDYQSILKHIKETSCIIDVYHLVGNKATFVILLGFRDMEDLESHFNSVQDCMENIEVTKMIKFSTHCIIKRDFCGLIKDVLNHPDSLSKIHSLSCSKDV